MQAKERTTLGMLKVGDRFHFASDKSKHVWQVKALSDQVEKSWIHKGTVIKAEAMVQDDNGAVKYPKTTTEVIFLRSTQNEPATA